MLLETLVQDIRYALRTLRRTPAFATTAVLTLGVGLGLNTMLFTLFNSFVLRPLAVNDPYSLYQVSFSTKASSVSAFDWQQFEQVRTQSPVFGDALAAGSFGTRAGSRSLTGVLVSNNYFPMLGVKMAIGRPLNANDRLSTVLDYRLWQSMFGGAPSVLGRTLLANGQPLEIVGVCQSDFEGMPPSDSPFDFYVPAVLQSAIAPTVDHYAIVGRLRPGVPVARARAALSIQARALTALLPEADRAIGVTLTSRATSVPLDAKIVAVFTPLLVVFGLVLVICCANVMNMMLARTLARQREIGVRLSLGAARGRLIRQLLAESLLLATLAGATGLLVSSWGLRAAGRLIVSTMPKSYANIIAIGPVDADRRVFLFLVLAAAVVTVVSGLAPALQATNVNLVGALRGELSARFRASRLRGALVVSQVAVCLLLLVLTGVLLRDSASLQHQEPGFELRGMVAPLIFSHTADLDSAKLAHYLEAQPWVAGVAGAFRAPLTGLMRSTTVRPAGHANAESASYNVVSPEYFGVVGIPLTRGRNFAAGESGVVIVSQATANRFWPHEDALGKSIDAGDLRSRGLVVGIAKDVVSGMLFSGEDRTMIYFPGAIGSPQERTLVVRGKGDSARIREQLETALITVFPDRGSLAVSAEDSYEMQVYPFRAAMLVALVLGGIALLLTVSGMYGVMSYVVGQRTREIGIRMALGATPGNVVRLILGQSGRLAVLGLGFGLIGSLAIARLIGAVFFMLRTFDLAAYIAGLAVVSAAALAAGWLPTRRASRINPIDTLRAE